MHSLIEIVAALGLVAWSVALLNTALNLWLIPRLRAGAPDQGPRVSVIIPARNEERTIERTVRAFLAQRYRNLEIIVVNDRSTDGTGAILARLAAEQPGLRVITGAAPPDGWLGKPWALHQGAARAQGELLLLVDADIIYAPDAVAAAVAEIERQGAHLLAVLPFIEMESFWEQVALPMLGYTFLTVLPSWLGNRTGTVWLAIGGGTGNLVRRDAYDAAGGHAALRAEVVDDVGLARLLRRHGFRTVALRADDLIRLRIYHGGREVLEGFTKNFFAVLGRRYWAVAAWLAAGIVIHLLPYVLAAAAYPPALVTVGLITGTRLWLFRSLRYRLDNAALAHPLMFLFWSWVLLRSTWITGVRGRLHWRGRTYDGTNLPGGWRGETTP